MFGTARNIVSAESWGAHPRRKRCIQPQQAIDALAQSNTKAFTIATAVTAEQANETWLRLQHDLTNQAINPNQPGRKRLRQQQQGLAGAPHSSGNYLARVSATATQSMSTISGFINTNSVVDDIINGKPRFIGLEDIVDGKPSIVGLEDIVDGKPSIVGLEDIIENKHANSIENNYQLKQLKDILSILPGTTQLTPGIRYDSHGAGSLVIVVTQQD